MGEAKQEHAKQSVGAVRDWLIRELSAGGPWDRDRFRGLLAAASGKLSRADDYSLVDAKLVMLVFEPFQRLLKLELGRYRAWLRKYTRSRSEKRWTDYEVGPYRPGFPEAYQCLKEAGALAPGRSQGRVPTKRLAAIYTCRLLSASLPGRPKTMQPPQMLQKARYDLPAGRTGKTRAELVIDKSRKIYKRSLARTPGPPLPSLTKIARAAGLIP